MPIENYQTRPFQYNHLIPKIPRSERHSYAYFKLIELNFIPKHIWCLVQERIKGWKGHRITISEKFHDEDPKGTPFITTLITLGKRDSCALPIWKSFQPKTRIQTREKSQRIAKWNSIIFPLKVKENHLQRHGSGYIVEMSSIWAQSSGLSISINAIPGIY